MAMTATELIKALRSRELLDESSEFVDVVVSGKKLDDKDLYEEFATDPFYNYYGILKIENDKYEKIADKTDFGGSLKLNRKYRFDKHYTYIVRVRTAQEKFVNSKGKEVVYNPFTILIPLIFK